MTSRDLVNIVHGRVRAEFGLKSVKVGHAGTLDPLAEGVLVVSVGIASRLTPYVQEHTKRYHATMRMGASTPSGDLEVEPTEHPELPLPTLDELRNAAKRMLGKIEQRPPAHSAVRIDGKRAYDLVRKGTVVEMPTRTVTIESLDVVSMSGRDCELEITCGSGTYIRSLIMDLAAAVGTRAVMTRLVRTAIGSFGIEEALTVAEIRPGPLLPHFRPLIDGVNFLPRLQVDAHDVHRLRNGLFVPESTIVLDASGKAMEVDEAIFVDNDGHLRGIVRREVGFWKPYRVFHEP
jgi:tRNA pseudouridine55 synthase